MRVHITLDKEIRSDGGAMQSKLEEIRSVAALRDVNETRFHRYGVISADVPETSVDRIKDVSGVKSVEADEIRHAI
ncbi:MAG TPA: hypothetical protein VF624_12655 [Tepidisphaeraceae bacterium]|jgi:hypothetical protein